MSDITIHNICGISAALLSAGAGVLYLLDIIRGATRPNRATWWALALLNSALTASYYASGARETIWLPLDYALSFLIVGVVSIWRGYGAWTGFDIACLFGTIAGIALWWGLRSPAAALGLFIVIELIAFTPTVIKAYRHPETEHLGAWVAATLATLLNIFAITKWTAALYVYPVYALLGNVLFLAMLIVRRRSLPSSLAA